MGSDHNPDNLNDLISPLPNNETERIESTPNSKSRHHLVSHANNRKGYRKYPVPTCEHKDRSVFAKGLCTACYHRQRRDHIKGLSTAKGFMEKSTEIQQAAMIKMANNDADSIETESIENIAEELGVPVGTELGKAIVSNAKHSIDAALTRAGIDDERLARVAAEGLSAMVVKTATFEGEISDEREYVDWNSRHKFWHDLNVIKGHMAPDGNEGGGGGLVIVNGPTMINTGHKPGCRCDVCVKAWEAEGREVLRQQRQREVTMNLNDVPQSIAPAAAPQTIDSDDQDDWS